MNSSKPWKGWILYSVLLVSRISSLKDIHFPICLPEFGQEDKTCYTPSIHGMDWSFCTQECKIYHAELATIADYPSYLDLILKLLSTTRVYWIAASRNNTEWRWTNAKNGTISNQTTRRRTTTDITTAPAVVTTTWFSSSTPSIQSVHTFLKANTSTLASQASSQQSKTTVDTPFPICLPENGQEDKTCYTPSIHGMEWGFCIKECNIYHAELANIVDSQIYFNLLLKLLSHGGVYWIAASRISIPPNLVRNLGVENPGNCLSLDVQNPKRGLQPRECNELTIRWRFSMITTFTIAQKLTGCIKHKVVKYSVKDPEISFARWGRVRGGKQVGKASVRRGQHQGSLRRSPQKNQRASYILTVTNKKGTISSQRTRKGTTKTVTMVPSVETSVNFSSPTPFLESVHTFLPMKTSIVASQAATQHSKANADSSGIENKASISSPRIVATTGTMLTEHTLETDTLALETSRRLGFSISNANNESNITKTSSTIHTTSKSSSYTPSTQPELNVSNAATAVARISEQTTIKHDGFSFSTPLTKSLQTVYSTKTSTTVSDTTNKQFNKTARYTASFCIPASGEEVCYYYFEDRRNLLEAVALCRGLGMEIFHFDNNNAMAQSVREQLRNKTDGVWLGAIKITNGWGWLNGTTKYGGMWFLMELPHTLMVAFCDSVIINC
ncbi:hypothetical protein CHS0354_016389 [Potamilus streckersoni]|uniref:C-type lectin domain-containing protein n=1 Tax=Potamilus streckersoni TaxID=2493646 RepID=A0AAE0SW25_9BIVA|nr:hypothetical protein CHS0354_016389 [Potamilus streckersoni]